MICVASDDGTVDGRAGFMRGYAGYVDPLIRRLRCDVANVGQMVSHSDQMDSERVAGLMPQQSF